MEKKISKRQRIANSLFEMGKEALSILSELSQMKSEDVKWVKEKLNEKMRRSGIEKEMKDIVDLLDEKTDE